MRRANFVPSFLADRPSLRRRASSLVLALLATMAIILVLLGINARVSPPPRFKGGGPVMINISADKSSDSSKQAKKAAAAEPHPSAGTPPPPPALRIPKPVVELPPVTKGPLTQIIQLTQVEEQDFSLKMRSGAPARASGAPSASTAGDSKAIGTAPNGEPLYAAQWYRHPTHTELSLYLPKIMPSEGSGLIACRTAARYHVEDCIELGSSPPGSHLAGAVRQAAWQFLVRPPRLGGKEMIGAWVQIRIDYSEKVQDQP